MIFDMPATMRVEGEAAAKEQITLRGNVPHPKVLS
jgi:hypothetical protein